MSTYMFELQENLSGQLYPLLVDMLDGHQVPLRGDRVVTPV